MSVCTRCVMDSSVADIRFDEEGRCNYCAELVATLGFNRNPQSSEVNDDRERVIARIKSDGAGKPYDCIVGVSGGVDSSWVLVQAVKAGLRPLAVHMDNGWNSELAQNNIEQLVRRLGVDLFTYVIDWNEYRDLQQAFFDADVIDIELLYDNALMGVNYAQANRYGLRHILSGSNSSTEGVRIPDSWFWSCKVDLANIMDIWISVGRGYRLRSFPGYSVMNFYYDRNVRRISWNRFLDLFDYSKQGAVEVLERDYGYVPYQYKHYESVFTRFYQGYLLPEKFGVDKRKPHLSSLVVTGQMDRSEALDILARPPYADARTLERDIEYFLKKMGWTREQLNAYLERPPVGHDRFRSEHWKIRLYARIAGMFDFLRPLLRRWLR